MNSLRALLIILWVALAAYTAFVIAHHGMGLLPIFIGDIAQLTWSGQFNVDFLYFLILSAFWTAWRNGFSTGGLGLALIAFFGGAGFLLPYLLYLSFSTGGSVRRILLGVHD